MKKYLMMGALLGMALASCEDVPAPYEIFDESTEGTQSSVLIDEDFSTSLGDFQSVSAVGSVSWTVSYSCAQVTSFVDTDGDGQKENTEADVWLVSPAIDATLVDSAYISFEYILRYALASTLTENHQLLVSTDYSGLASEVASASWTALSFPLVQGADWDTWYESGKVIIPEEFLGKDNLRVALRYRATTAKASTWEVKNFVVMEGLGEEQEEPEIGGIKTLPYSESFATSFGSFVNVTTSGAGEWTIDYSTAKASGYDNASKVTTAGTYYLVSPEISLEGVTEAHVAYDYILRYDRGAENQQVLISADYVDDPTTATWAVLKNDHTEGADWTTFASAKPNIPAEYMGKTIRIAFYYNTNATSGSTWEVKNFIIDEGKGEESGADTPEVGGLKTLPYSETFKSSLGSFVNETTSGAGEWINDYSTAKASGYDNASATTTAGTYYLVSPEISLEGVTEAHVMYEYILRYDQAAENQKVLISADYVDNATTATWAVLNQTHTEGSDWVTFSSADIAVPAEYMGKVIRLAFYYNADASNCSTWEVRNFSILSGKVGDAAPDAGGSGGDYVVPEGDNLLGNAGFEVWNGNTPTNWASTTTASSASLSQSTDARTGSYAVLVGGSTSGNKRLAYREITLKAGTYQMQFYVKAATAEGGSVRPGYAIVEGGKLSGDSYKYADYVNDLTQDTWTEVNHTFELTAETTVNILVMNPKNPGKDILIDDFSLTTADGGLVDDGTSDDDAGSGDASDEENNYIAPEGDNLVGNPSFEIWENGVATNWTATTTIGTSTLTQSADARTGSYALQLAGAASNQLMAYHPVTLKAGTYKISFYAKAATADGGTVQAGYQPVVNGTAGSFVYGDRVENLTADAWVEVTQTFTLTAETTINMVVRNYKTPGKDVLIDDFALTTADGGLVE